MPAAIKNGNYVVPLRNLKFKENVILFPYGNDYGHFLSYSGAPQEYLTILKKIFHRSSESISYQVENNLIIRIENLESLIEKLRIQNIVVNIDNKNPQHATPTKRLPKSAKPKFKSISTKNAHKIKVEQTPTIKNVSIYFKQPSRNIIEYLVTKGYPRLALRSVLSKPQYDLLSAEFSKKRVPSGLLKAKKEIVWTEFLNEQPHKPAIQRTSQNIETEEKTVTRLPKGNQLQLTRDIFITIVKEVEYGSLSTIYSYFTDIQAQLICSRMSSSYARSIADKQSKLKAREDMDLVVYQLHYMANKALQVFGGKILTLIYDLPQLRFAQGTALEVRTYKNVRPDFPMISFQTNQVQVNVAFFTKLHPHRNQLQPHVILFEHMTYDTIGLIDVLGHIRLKLTSFRPQLSLFIDRINDKQYKIYSGVQTGVCDICKRSLKNPLSLRMGIGPVCAKNIGLDRSVYEY